ncbi:lipocalin [Maritimibacter sp. UBA3975]|uniref:lipocalin n=1 Tax=Maritimibacter sp. UBA3975 TaxID=1946833 RepID=UPI000C0A63A0|nr:lipocalin [Maritimibacter sp. UBA3975]MAM60728.1 lipocalin [Maritimibacter sp.]|tara:strand:+ start:14449 stop:14895 length:447 start_codon:yes stop_codon:yes gene_type:complete
MKAFIVAALLTLAACSTGGPDTPRMTAVAGFDVDRLMGQWVEVGAVGRAPGGRWSFHDREGDTLFLVRPGGENVVTAIDRGNGRLDFADATGTLFVLWADADDRTLVLGRPDNRFGAILNKGGAIPPDRLRAAREIMVWNGYDAAEIR